METSVNNSTEASLNTWNCLHCRRRKIRCDRHNPCSHCTRAGLDCVFPVSGRLPTRRNTSSGAAVHDAKRKQTELLGRVRHLESIVTQLHEQLGRRFEEESCMNSSLATATSGSGSHKALPGSQGTPLKPGKLLETSDGKVYMGSHLWACLLDEATNIRHTIEDGLDEDKSIEEELVYPETPSNASSYTGLYVSRPRIEGPNLQKLQPLPSQMPYLWQKFVANVDPYVKVLHVPTAMKIVNDSRGKISSTVPRIQALLFAISACAVTSLTEEEVSDSFHETKSQLLGKLLVGTEQALINAGFLDTSDIVVVQAFLLYLESYSHVEVIRPGWPLAGLLVRTALAMGLHRDGSQFPELSPFEVELRRRVWWQICFIDSRAGDNSLPDIRIDETLSDTHQPGNYNDADLDPGMASLPPPREGVTDTTMALVRAHLWQFDRQLDNIRSLATAVEQKDVTIRAFIDKIESRILRHLKVDEPLHMHVAALTRLAAARAELTIRPEDLASGTAKGVRLTYVASRNRAFLVSVAVLDCARTLIDWAPTRGWSWIFAGCAAWQPLTVLLLQLCSRPWGPTCESALELVDRTITGLPLAVKRDPAHRPVWSLVTDARRHRAKEICRIQGDPDVSHEMARRKPITFEQGWEFTGERREIFDTAAAEALLDEEAKLSMRAKASNTTQPPTASGSKSASLAFKSTAGDSETGVNQGMGDEEPPWMQEVWPQDASTAEGVWSFREDDVWQLAGFEAEPFFDMLILDETA